MKTFTSLVLGILLSAFLCGLQNPAHAGYNFVKASNHAIRYPTKSAPVNAWSCSLWLRCTTTPGTGYPAYFVLFIDKQVYVHCQATKLTFEYNDGANTIQPFNATTSWTTGVWYHIAVVADWVGDTVKIYRDGVALLDTAMTSGSPRNVTGTEIFIGRLNAAAGGTNGDLAEVATWDEVALSESQIISLSKGLAPNRINPHPIRYFPLVRNTHELTSGATATLQNTPTVTVHPRIYR